MCIEHSEMGLDVYAPTCETLFAELHEQLAMLWREALPLLASMHAWLKVTRMMVANGGGTAKAIDYSLKRWSALTRYAESGKLPIDNNPVENAIRPLCLARRTGSSRVPNGRQARRRHPELAGDRCSQRTRSGGLAAHYFGEISNPSQQRYRFATSASSLPSSGSRRLNPRGRVGRIHPIDLFVVTVARRLSANRLCH
ncbi:MAG: transposase [Xanthomonadaceae bacterium]|nr:transposase [Xanthomonadaceae bacterium]